MAWAESPNSLYWEKRGPLLGKGPKGRFDDYGIATRQIIKHDGQSLLFYEGCQDVALIRRWTGRSALPCLTMD